MLPSWEGGKRGPERTGVDAVAEMRSRRLRRRSGALGQMGANAAAVGVLGAAVVVVERAGLVMDMGVGEVVGGGWLAA